MSIVENRKAFHDYFIEERFEAGIALEGWEVKAIRGGRANLKEAYVVVKNGELMLIGAHISPLSTASTHVHPDPTRTRRLLLHREEINRLIGQVERAGYTLTPLDLRHSPLSSLHFESRRGTDISTAELQVSLDGQTWQSLAQVPASDDWVGVDVDLSQFAGQIVYLRFVMNAAPGDRPQPAHWQIRRLAIY